MFRVNFSRVFVNKDDEITFSVIHLGVSLRPLQATGIILFSHLLSYV